MIFTALCAALPAAGQVETPPRAYYGRNGVPMPFRVSTEHIAVQFKKDAGGAAISAIMRGASSAVQAPAAEQVSAMEKGEDMSVVTLTEGMDKEQVLWTVEALRELPEVAEARPVCVFNPDTEEAQTPYLYANFRAGIDEQTLCELFDAMRLEIVERVDYSAIGKIGYRLRIPEGSNADPIAAANRLFESGVCLEAAPVFAHLYQTPCSVYPNDPLFQGCQDGTTFPQINTRQYSMYSNCVPPGEGEGEGECPCEAGSESAPGHINLPGAWDLIYDVSPNGGFALKSQFEGNYPVIACLDNGVMLDYRYSTHNWQIPAACDENENSVEIGSTRYYGHPDLQPNQWFNPVEQQYDHPGEGEPEGTCVGECGTGPDDCHCEGHGKCCDDDGNGYVDDYFGWDFVDNDPWPYPVAPNDNASFHGTFAMGVADARGNNGEGIAGVCWHAKIMPIRYERMTYLPQTSGDNLWDLHVVDAVNYAAKAGADIITIAGAIRAYDPQMHDALLDARSRGRILVAPAGNAGYDIDTPVAYSTKECPNYPAALPEVICVGATNKYDQRCTYWDWDWHGGKGSNYGWVLDVMAPSRSGPPAGYLWWGQPLGCNFPEDHPPLERLDWYVDGGGTSTAMPHMAGLAALLLTVDPHLSHADVQAISQWSAKDLVYDVNTSRGLDAARAGRDEQTGWGLLDATAAVQWAMRKRFALRNSAGKNLVSIDDHGYMAIDGNVIEDATEQQLTSVVGIKEFLLQRTIDNVETVLARLYPKWDTNPANPCETVWPTLYLKGKLVKNQGTLSPPARSFKVQDHDGNVVAYISSQDTGSETSLIPAGSLVLKNDAFIGADPDPQARRLELVLYDTFEDGDYSAPVTAYDYIRYGSVVPGWDVDHGTWYVTGTYGNRVLQNDAVNNASAQISIGYPGGFSTDVDVYLDINVDFLCSSTTDTLVIGINGSTSWLGSPLWVTLNCYQTDQNVTAFCGGFFDPPQQIGDAGSFTVADSKWYEMHVYLHRMKGPTTGHGIIQVWLRERDATEGSPWIPVVSASNVGVRMSGPDQRCSLTVIRPSQNGGNWSFDNFVCNASFK